MMRIRFSSEQVYETGGPGKGPRFPSGFVLDIHAVPEILNDAAMSKENAAAFLRRWVNRGVAEAVGNDVAAWDPSQVNHAPGVSATQVVRPFGTERHGRPAEGLDGDDSGGGVSEEIDFNKLTRAQLDALAEERKVDIADAKNKEDVIAALKTAAAAADQSELPGA